MKNIFPILGITSSVFLLLLISCNHTKSVKKETIKEVNKINKPEFQTILDSFNVEGSICFYDQQNNVSYSNNFERCDSGFLPASTFKIANSIIALETGVIANDSTIIKWNGVQHPVETWNQDLTFREAFQFSCVPCYREIARQIGFERMAEYLQKLNYGEMKVTEKNLDMFWLFSDSRISQNQQIYFLRRFYFDELPIKKSTQETVKRIMLADEIDGYKLYAKTGRTRGDLAWYVGFFEKGEEVYFFAVNFKPKGEFYQNTRKDVTVKAFQSLLNQQ